MVCAPMVGASELAFRLLVRKYGADLCYTPMLYADKFVNDPKYRNENFFEQQKMLSQNNSTFQEEHTDRPLVVHFCGNCPETLLKACRLVEESDYADAFDLNLGCPQRIAYSGKFGAYLLGEEDRSLLKNIVSTCSSNLRKPFCVKIRLLDSYDDTKKLCEDLYESGCSLVAVHARTRGSATRRREGPADLKTMKKLVEGFKGRISFLANGNVLGSGDVVDNWKYTKADGIMSAEGLLDNPRIFSFRAGKQEPPKEPKEDPFNLALAEEYLQLAERYPPPASEKGSGFSTVLFHVRRMCKSVLTKYHLLERALGSESIADLRDVLAKCAEYVNADYVGRTGEGAGGKEPGGARGKEPAACESRKRSGAAATSTVSTTGAAGNGNGILSERKSKKAKVLSETQREIERPQAFDAEVAKKEQLEFERKKKEAKEEKRFLDRMARKAKREGRKLEEVVKEHRAKSEFFQSCATKK
eukprot:g5998.t1